MNSDIIRKRIVQKQYSFTEIEKKTVETLLPILTEVEKKVVKDVSYTTNNEDFILIKDVVKCEITLDSNITHHIIIKSLTNSVIKPSTGKIDELYDEIEIGRGACVELITIDGLWYVISSDGVKLD